MEVAASSSLGARKNDISFFSGLNMKTYFKTVNQGQDHVWNWKVLGTWRMSDFVSTYLL